MNLADTNFWVALSITTHPLHVAARDWFAEQREGERVLFCRVVQQSFLRLITTEPIMRAYGVLPLSNAQAWAMYEKFAADARVALAAEPRDIGNYWPALALRESASPKLWMDAYLAAFAIAGNHRLVTFDRAFSQFSGLDLLVLSSPASAA